jgi:hypothetical protein
MEEIQKAEQN